MRLQNLVFGLPLLALLGGAPSLALAGKAASTTAEAPLPKIEPTGIAEFDSVFMKAKGIHDTLDTQTAAFDDARKGVNKAAGIAEDQPLDTAIAALKTAANGKITLNTSGATPRVKPAAGAPDDVQKSCDAINRLLDAGEQTLGVVKDLEPQAKEVAAAAAGFPAQLLTMKMDVSKLLDAKKKVGNDTKATAATPDRVKRLGDAATGAFTAVKNAFTEG
jgi:hypothetical protein